MIDAEKTAEIAEDASRYPEFLRQAQREGEADRADIIFVAAQRVICRDVARTDAGRGETAQIVAPDEETILDADALTEAVNVADLAGQAEDVVRREGIVVGAGHLAADVPHIATGAGEIGTERDQVALGRIGDAIAPVVGQDLADR